MIYILDGQQQYRTLTEIRSLPNDERIHIAKNARFYNETGAEVVGAQRDRLRAKVLGQNRGLERRVLAARRTLDEPKMLIPGLLPWNAHPTLGSPPKVGKSMTVVAGLAAALTLPGMRFLGRFEPADLSMDPRYERLKVAIVNAEMDPAAFEDLVCSAYGDGRSEIVVDATDGDFDDDPGRGAFPTIYHLRQLGGPRMFDLTDPVIYDEWVNLLTLCEQCPDDEESPSVLIVDGLTAILAAAGKGPEQYGFWRGRFGQLVDDVGIPVSLVTAHTTMKGDHLMEGVTSMAGPDGIWKLAKGRHGVREFSVPDPRHPAPEVKPFPLERLADGRIVEKIQPISAPGPKPDQVPKDLTVAVIEFIVKEHADGRAPSGNDVVRAVEGRTDDVLGALSALVSGGQIVKRPRRKRGGGVEYVPADGDQPTA